MIKITQIKQHKLIDINHPIYIKNPTKTTQILKNTRNQKDARHTDDIKLPRRISLQRTRMHAIHRIRVNKRRLSNIS